MSMERGEDQLQEGSRREVEMGAPAPLLGEMQMEQWCQG